MLSSSHLKQAKNIDIQILQNSVPLWRKKNPIKYDEYLTHSVQHAEKLQHTNKGPEIFLNPANWPLFLFEHKLHINWIKFQEILNY